MATNDPHPSATPTLRLRGDDPRDIAIAADLLRRGGIVAMPTETVYGLAGSALNTLAAQRIFHAKDRPHWDPLIVHVRDIVMATLLVRTIPPVAQQLIDAFWPGPLTLLLPRNSSVPDIITAGRDLVGLRMPSHPVALELLRATALPLAAPSANRFGHISPTTAQHVLDDLDGRIDAVLDAGPCDIGVESTVFDPVALVLYRQGGISQHQLEAVLGHPITIYQREEQPALEATANQKPFRRDQEGQRQDVPLQDVSKQDVPRHQALAEPLSLPSPGIGMRHYAPAAHVVLAHSQDDLRHRLARLPPDQTAVLLPEGWTAPAFHGPTVAWASWDNPKALARTLYSALRTLDELDMAIIVIPIPAPSPNPLVEAIRDRLTKAARNA